MSSLFRQARRFSAYQPDPARAWNGSYLLLPEPSRQVFRLDWARDLFDLDPACPDEVWLRFDDAQRQAILEFGPHSLVRAAPLAGYGEFTGLEVLRFEYLHERDWPAEDEKVVGVRVVFRAGARFLAFRASDYKKFGSAYQSRSFLEFLKGLAGRMGCPCSVEHLAHRPREW